MDLSGFAESPPGQRLDLVFIHHSVGGHWLAAPGPEAGANCIVTSHPNGGGLRSALEEQGYEVHEASYGSRVGQDTDIVHWPPKFRDQMDQILPCRHQDLPLPDGRRNRIVVFKSCYPNNAFVGPGTPPGRAASQSTGTDPAFAGTVAATVLEAAFSAHARAAQEAGTHLDAYGWAQKARNGTRLTAARLELRESFAEERLLMQARSQSLRPAFSLRRIRNPRPIRPVDF